MLRFNINQEQYDALSDQLKAEYKKTSDGYTLDTVGDHPSVTAAQNQLVTVAGDKLKVEQQLAEANAKLANADATAEAKYKKDLDAVTAERDTLRQTTVNAAQTAAINAIADKFNNPELFAGVLSSRVRTEITDKGEVKTTYFDKDAKETTLEKLTAEYTTNPQYATMLKKGANTVTVPQAGAPNVQPPVAPTPAAPYNAGNTNTAPVVTTDTAGMPVVDMGRASPAQIRDAIAARQAASPQQ